MIEEWFYLQKNSFLIIILWIMNIVVSIEYDGVFYPKNMCILHVIFMTTFSKLSMIMST